MRTCVFCPKFNLKQAENVFVCTDTCADFVERNGTCVDACDSGLYFAAPDGVKMCLDECHFYREADPEHNQTKCVQRCP